MVVGNADNEEGWFRNGTPNNQAVMGTNARKLYLPNPVPNQFYSRDTDNWSSEGVSGDGLRESYYAFEWGNALFVVLDPYWHTTTKPHSNTGGYATGSGTVGGIAFSSEDIVAYDSATGLWSMFFDGSDVGIGLNNLDGFALLGDGSILMSFTRAQSIGGLADVDDSDIYLSSSGAFTVGGVSGDASDIFVCAPLALGATTTCSYTLFWDAAAAGFGSGIDGLAIIP